MRILFVSHTALVSGAERSLLALLPGLAHDGVECVVACPEGELAERVRALGVPVVTIGETTISWRLSLHTPPALARMLMTAVHLRRLTRRLGATCVHANSVRAGLIALAARSLGGPPVVVHVRDQLPRGWLAGLTARVLARSDLLVAISAHVARSLEPQAAGGALVVHNPIDVLALGAAGDGALATREELGLPEDAVVLAVIGQITPWKAQDDAIRILARVRQVGRPAHLLVIGAPTFVHRDVTYDNQGFARSLHRLAAELGMLDAVHFLGHREDIARLLGTVDVALVPSWQEPFGRVVVEAMAVGTCVVATAAGGPSEIITDGRDGRLLAPRDPQRWAAVVLELIDDPRERATLGERARARARDFAIQGTVDQMLRCYVTVGSPLPASWMAPSPSRRGEALDGAATHLGAVP